MKQCISDSWLLSHFRVAELLDKKHHAICCKPGALLGTDEAFRCSFDWPSNDVPDCRIWLHLRKELLAVHSEGAAPELVVDNLATLVGHAKSRFRCTP